MTMQLENGPNDKYLLDSSFLSLCTNKIKYYTVNKQKLILNL